jgi:hypothetical protein
MAADPYLVDLAEQLRALADSPEHRARRHLWAEALALRSCRPPVSFYIYEWVWARELGAGMLRYERGLEAQVERSLVFQIWRARHLPDDWPAHASMVLHPLRPKRQRPFPWGLELELRQPDGHGAYKPVPAIRGTDDLDRLVGPVYAEDLDATEDLVARARELVGDAAQIRLHSDELHWGPFEHAVRLRGMDQLLLDVYDRPEFVHRLMARLTTGMVDYHRQREAAGRVCAGLGIGHVPPRDVAPPLGDRLAGSWGYLHAQSSASYSPAMYSEFIQPYNYRIAELVGWVYYHGCEDLSRKCVSVGELPNLRLFHISPWTPPEPVIAHLGKRVAYEVHAHPTTVIFSDDRAAIRRELAKLHPVVKDVPHVWALADVETFAGRFERAVYWAHTARELSR